MKKPNNSIIKAVLFFALLTIAFFSCKKSDPAVTPTVATVPVVTNVQPKNPMPGDVVTITGTGFGTTATDVKVTIGTQNITITTVSDTEIKFTLPTSITAGDIAVAIKSVVANNTDPQKATITPVIPTPTAATIISINPTSGKAGDVVSILGTGFGTVATDNVVKFNGVAATVTGSVTSVLTVTVPAGVTTGPVTVSVKGAAVVTGPTFTVTTATGGTGTAVPYIVSVGGTGTFTKIATAASEIGAMVVDKINNVLYYSDYSPVYDAHAGNIYKLKLDGSAPVVLTTDARIGRIDNLAVDASGNVYAVSAIDLLVKVNVYKIDATTQAITVLGTNVTFGGGGASQTLNVDAAGGVWFGFSQKLNTATNVLDRTANASAYGSLNSTPFQGDNVYVDDFSHSAIGNVLFYKYNLRTSAATVTDFTLQGLFKQDNPAMNSNSANMDIYSKYALDNSENFYAIYNYAGDAASGYNNYYVIRKTKNGAGGANTLISKFYSKAYTTNPTVTYLQPKDNLGVFFQTDATGNLYMKDNGTDIIKITP